MNQIYLTSKAILRGTLSGKDQLYHVVGTTVTGDEVIITFKALSCYSSSLDNAFRRLQPVTIKKEEEKKEDGTDPVSVH